MRTPVILFLFTAVLCRSQPRISLTGTGFIAQHGGHIGEVAAGPAAKFQRHLFCALLYGWQPTGDGAVHAATLKLAYEPFDIPLREKLRWNTISVGAFFAQHFGRNLRTRWDPHYPEGYYWWPRNTRSHLSLSTALALRAGQSDVSIFLEANAGDLGLMSWLPNTRSIRFHEIVGLAAGLRLVFNKRAN